ncbi:hypothetical protein LIA77_06856 [Sarocladium implicatum]|nr:hypothetical protein LIA77_06856 [Sarocladium implicatum]
MQNSLDHKSAPLIPARAESTCAICWLKVILLLPQLLRFVPAARRCFQFKQESCRPRAERFCFTMNMVIRWQVFLHSLTGILSLSVLVTRAVPISSGTRDRSVELGILGSRCRQAKVRERVAHVQLSLC